MLNTNAIKQIVRSRFLSEKKTDTLSKKLKSYSLLASALAGSGVAANGQIIYTDVDPDSTFFAPVGVATLEFDLNNDGVFDYDIKTVWITSTGESAYSKNVISINPASGNSVATVTTYLDWMALACEDGFEIHQNLEWNVGSHRMAFHTNSSSYGPFLGQSEKYLALRFIISGEQHYGWMRVSVGGHAEFITIHDYAYESMPDSALGAGCISGVTIYADADGDEYGDPANSIFSPDCILPSGYVLNNTDCDDVNSNVHPNAVEICNSIDDDCINGLTKGLPSPHIIRMPMPMVSETL